MFGLKLKKSAAVLAAALCFCLSGCSGGGSTASADEEAPSVPVLRSTGKPMASLSAENINSGELSFKPGPKQHLTVVTVWSPEWYDKSSEQIRFLESLRSKYSAPGLRIICLAYDTPPAKVKKLIKEQKIPFEIGVGSPELYNKLKVQAVPCYWFLDSDGNTLEACEGLMTFEDMDAKIGGFIRDYGGEPKAE